MEWLCGDRVAAKQQVGALSEDAGHASIDLGGTARSEVIEAPRRARAVYGEEGDFPRLLRWPRPSGRDGRFPIRRATATRHREPAGPSGTSAIRQRGLPAV